MSNMFNISKVITLPTVYTPSTLYFVQASELDLIEVYLSDNLGQTVKHILTKIEITALIESKLQELEPLVFNQDIPSMTWEITHGFNYRPSVKVIDSANDEVYGSVSYPSSSTVRIEFSAQFSGQAILS